MFTIVIGVACAVGVLVSMLAMGVGVGREAMGNVRPDRVILMSIGADGSHFKAAFRKMIVPLILLCREYGEVLTAARLLERRPCSITQARKKDTGRVDWLCSRRGHSGLAGYRPKLR